VTSINDVDWSDLEMKRHPVLTSLSHDHHHGLVEARRLQRAADGPAPALAAAAFLRFFADETARHFRDEEQRLFPSVVEFQAARDLLLDALLEHQVLRAQAAQLQQRVDSNGDVSTIMRELGRLLVSHIRAEERQLFPLIERLLHDEAGSLLPSRGATLNEQSAGAHVLTDPVGTEMEYFPIAEVRAQLEAHGGGWEVVHESPNLEVGVLVRIAPTPDPPVRHTADEIYVVLAGEATLQSEGHGRRLKPGDVAFVPVGKEHHFVDYERISLLVLFARGGDNASVAFDFGA
jgi:mannose-6-phosphate isomerase-like protein (cupin superfamily)